MPSKDIPSATSTFVLVRTVAGAVGVSIGGAIYSTRGRTHLRQVAGGIEAVGSQPDTSLLQMNVEALSDLTPPALKRQVLVRCLLYWMRCVMNLVDRFNSMLSPWASS